MAIGMNITHILSPSSFQLDERDLNDVCYHQFYCLWLLSAIINNIRTNQ